MKLVVGLVAGMAFGAGLALSDMVNPARVLNFLDVAGAWDPTLIFVMAGGLAVAGAGFALARRRPGPLFDARFHLPTARRVDRALLGGAALFGVGWGMAGICPGPALAGIVTLEPKLGLFLATLALGLLAGQAARARLRRAADPGPTTAPARQPSTRSAVTPAASRARRSAGSSATQPSVGA